MAKIKVSFLALDLRGKQVRFTETYDNVPDFQKLPKREFFGTQLPETTIVAQQIDWLDEQDKWDIIVKRDISSILDYQIVDNALRLSQPSESEIIAAKNASILEFIMTNVPETSQKDYIAVWQAIKPQIQKFSASKQLEQIISHLKVSLHASNAAYQRIIDIYRCHDEDEKAKAKLHLEQLSETYEFKMPSLAQPEST